MRCAEEGCCRRAEVVVQVDALAVVACLSCGIRIALELRGRMRLLGTGAEVTVTDPGEPRGRHSAG